MSVPGLFLINDFLTADEQSYLVKEITSGTWVKNRTGSREIQIFGPYHDKKYQIIKGKFSPHPKWYSDIAIKLKNYIQKEFLTNKVWVKNAEKYTNPEKAEIYVNKYHKGDGLRPHFDHRTTYDEVICGLSLLSDSKMTFIKGKNSQSVKIPKGSLYLMTGDSRKKFKHSIALGDINDTRISITVRSVNN